MTGSSNKIYKAELSDTWIFCCKYDERQGSLSSFSGPRVESGSGSWEDTLSHAFIFGMETRMSPRDSLLFSYPLQEYSLILSCNMSAVTSVMTSSLS